MEELFRLPLWSWGLFVAGACIGSYLNVVIYRWPREGLSVTSPSRSFCPICEEEIPWYRNIPLLTWLLQRGKCASCGAPISVRYPCVELLTAVLFMRAWDVFVVDRNPISPIAALLVATLAVLLVTIAWIDADLMLVPVDFCWWGMRRTHCTLWQARASTCRYERRICWRPSWRSRCAQVSPSANWAV